MNPELTVHFFVVAHRERPNVGLWVWKQLQAAGERLPHWTKLGLTSYLFVIGSSALLFVTKRFHKSESWLSKYEINSTENRARLQVAAHKLNSAGNKGGTVYTALRTSCFQVRAAIHANAALLLILAFSSCPLLLLRLHHCPLTVFIPLPSGAVTHTSLIAHPCQPILDCHLHGYFTIDSANVDFWVQVYLRSMWCFTFKLTPLACTSQCCSNIPLRVLHLS